MSDARSVVQSVAKTFAVLGAFTAEQAELTISEVGEMSCLPGCRPTRALLRSTGDLAAALQKMQPGAEPIRRRA